MMEQENGENRIFPNNSVRVCIDQCEEDFRGRVYSKLSEEPLKFENFSELLLKTDQLFDRCGYPQSFMEKRNFLDKKKIAHYYTPKILLKDEEVLIQKGKKYTADIFVKSRRKGGWRGYLVQPHSEKPVEFHSEMELLHLLCSGTGWIYSAGREKQ